MRRACGNGGRSGGNVPMRRLLLLAAFLLAAPLALTSPVGASTAPTSSGARSAERPAAPAHAFRTAGCTTTVALRHGTKVVTVRGTRVVTVRSMRVVTVRRVKIVRVRLRHHGRLVWVRRRVAYQRRERVPYRHRKRELYRHRKRVVYRFHVTKRHCPPPRPTASLTLSTSTLPATGGTVDLRYAATNASNCTLTSVPPLWSGSDPIAVSCNGDHQESVPATSSEQSWSITFTADGNRGQHATAVQTLTEQAPPAAPALPPVPAVSPGGGGTFGGGGAPGTGGGWPPVNSGGGTPPGGGGGTTPTPPSTALSITTTTLPDATEGAAYATQLAASGGSAPYAWSVVGGAPPAGLALSPAGALTGTATTTGTTSFTVQVTDSSAPTHEVAYATLSITVDLPSFPGLQSANWSGYIWPSTSLVTGVAGNWTVPTLDCTTTPNAGMSSWVGTGGAGGSSGDLLQTGIDSDCVNGVQQDIGWWQEQPEQVGGNFSSFPVSPGDVITAAVSDASGTWQTVLDDTTTGRAGVLVAGQSWGVGPDSGNAYTVQGDATGVSYAGGYTGEWIVEDYTLVATMQEVAFADFGSVAFTNMGLSPGPWYVEPQDEVELIKGGRVVATPTLPNNSTMTVTYTG